MSVSEVAEYLGVSPRAVRYWIAEGHFPNARRIGLRRKSPYVIPKSDVKAFDKKRRSQ